MFRKSRLGVSTAVHSSSVDILRKLVSLEGHIVKITPRGYELSNGIEYCNVGVKGEDGIEYSIQAYGEEASKLHDEAWMIMETPMHDATMDMGMNMTAMEMGK
jgi:hypothetical protein